MEEEKITMLQAFFKDRHITQKMICERTGMSQPQVSQLLTGKNKFGNKVAKKFEAEFGISYLWLMHGEGEMLVDEPNTMDKRRDVVGIPFYDDAKFGCSPTGFIGALMENQADDYFVLPGIQNDGKTFVVRARGESMVNKNNPELSIPNGAYVVIQKSALSTPLWGEAYALSTDDGCIIKRLYPSDKEGYVKCVSYNEEEYPSLELNANEIHDIGIVKAVLTINIWR